VQLGCIAAVGSPWRADAAPVWQWHLPMIDSRTMRIRRVRLNMSQPIRESDREQSSSLGNRNRVSAGRNHRKVCNVDKFPASREYLRLTA
jgi:hypothetical protein